MATFKESARVIPFPSRPRRPAAPAPDAVNLRLRQALAMLNAALAAQSKAIADWRVSAGTLQDSVGQLHANATSFQAALQSLADEIARTRAQNDRIAARTTARSE